MQLLDKDAILPDNFYEFTADDYFRIKGNAASSSKVSSSSSSSSSSTLLTRKHREEAEKKRMDKMRPVVIRIMIPDANDCDNYNEKGMVVETVFNAKDSVFNIFEFVKQCLVRYYS